MEFIATFHGATRKRSSVNGNPTWELNTSEGRYLTETDGSIGYSIGNYTGGPNSLIGKTVRFKATKSGRVWSMEPVQ